MWNSNKQHPVIAPISQNTGEPLRELTNGTAGQNTFRNQALREKS